MTIPPDSPLAFRRKRLGLLQKELAAREGANRQTLAKLERGEVGNPKLVTLKRLAEVFEIDLDEMFAVFEASREQ